MEKIVRQSLLYDFYGELLTDHQKTIYEEVVMNDMSYSEIGRIYGISRQGVYDMIKRCDKILEDYETKLKLVEKFVNAREKLAIVKSNINKLKNDNKDTSLDALIQDIDIETTKLLEDF
ncbi:MAG: DNA-binding protein [Lachnospiraceae bacterium]|nr:DNA-binding protein [Lachnospiraceae bacterium]